MSIDALALLHIEKLALPRHPTGVELYVGHHGDASIVSTWNKWDSFAPDELAMILGQKIGTALDAHDDPRGILFFPDVCEFHANDYETIARELTDMRAGFWTPKVGADHVPVRYTSARAGTHEALVMEMIERMGRDAALEFDTVARTHWMVQASGTQDLGDYVAQHLVELERSMGSEFSERYVESSRNQGKADLEAMQARREADAELYARAQRGEALVSPEEFSTFLASDAAAAVFQGFDPKFRAALEAELAGLDVEGRPDDDLAKQIAAALKRSKS